MKKITLLCFLITSCFGFSQNWTTGDVTLTTGYTVKFDVTSSTVTMTMVGPSNEWLGVGISNVVYSIGSQMGQFNDTDGSGDVVIYTNNSIQDRRMPGSNGTPPADSSSDWSLSSNDISGSTRTVVATRDRDTGDANDYDFPTSPPASFTLVWAKGGAGTNNSFGFHSGGRGAVLANNNVLSNDDFQLNPVRFTISPNPSSRNLNIGISYNASREYNIEAYDVLGKQIYRGQLFNNDTTIDVSNWRSGVYLVKLTSDEATQTKRFVKQ
ncbi:MAG: T9SS C-terminal target domain-containing protein [Winogradskyella sp.]|uniref:T9SS type A sorting domain-containing protein n=1 Tax=Winogradskyella sp. TaxID=1883156 RepID=UPI000F3F21B0|nr:T9SS type A sorting domain-containing protein [Winogradskyella sp.]RNC86982.1 MAG: T9SS C-terminal target domain-containing protein [Winogradskyella sp.]